MESLFDLIPTLEIDPVNKAKAKKDIKNALQDNGDEYKKAVIKKYADLVFTDDKLNDRYVELAGKEKERKIKQLENRIALSNSKDGQSVIRETTIKNTLSKEFNLSVETIVSLYKKANYEIISNSFEKKYRPKQWNTYKRLINTLNELLEENDCSFFLSDIYEIASYVDSGFREKPDLESRHSSVSVVLKDLNKELEKYNSLGSDKVQRRCYDVIANIITWNETDIVKYEFWSSYEKWLLTDAAVAINGLGPNDKRRQATADEAIKRIEEFFGGLVDHDKAVEIYNATADIEDNPYIPDSSDSFFVIRCPFCQSRNEFFDEAEAKNKNKCNKCNRELYRKCPKCKNMTRVDRAECNCGFIFERSDSAYDNAEKIWAKGTGNKKEQIAEKLSEIKRIDKDNTEIIEEIISQSGCSAVTQLKFRIKLFPDDSNRIKSFLYCIRKKEKGAEKAPWVDISEIETATDIHEINIKTYRTSKMIEMTMIVNSEADYYMSLFTKYCFDGTDIIAGPDKCKLSRKQEAKLRWKVKRKNLSIYIESNIDTDIPALVLCRSLSGNAPMSVNDAAAQIIAEFDEEIKDPKKNIISEEYVIDSDKIKINKNDKLYLFVKDKQLQKNFTVTWDKGFKGIYK